MGSLTDIDDVVLKTELSLFSRLGCFSAVISLLWHFMKRAIAVWDTLGLILSPLFPQVAELGIHDTVSSLENSHFVKLGSVWELGLYHEFPFN